MMLKVLRWLFPAVFKPKKTLALAPTLPKDFVLRKLNPRNYSLPAEIVSNLEKTAELYLQICALWGKSIPINSGYRSPDDQTRVYQAKGQLPKMGSAHIKGCAMDLSDVDGKLFAFLSQPEMLIKLGIFLESKPSTPTWTHVQWTPPRSGKRIFIP